MRRFLQLSVSLLIGGLLLWLSFREVNIGEAWDFIAQVPWWAWPAYFAFLSLTQVLRAARFRIQLRAMTQKPITFIEAFSLFSVGVAATFLVPFRLGEFVRPYLGKVRGHMSMSEGLSTVAAERVIDGINTTAMLGVVLLLMRDRQIPQVVYYAGYVALAIFGGALVIFVLGYLQRARAVALVHTLVAVISTRLADKIAHVADRFLQGLNTLPGLKSLLLYEAYTLAYWLINGATMYGFLRIMGVDIGWVGGFFVLSCLVIGVMVPAPPGNVGNFEYAIVLPLSVLGVGQSIGAAYAVAIHLMQAFQFTAVAIIIIGVGQVSLRRVVEATQQQGSGEEEGEVAPAS